MSDPVTHASSPLREQLEDALRSTARIGYPDAPVVHGAHIYDARCALCVSDIPALVDALLAAILPTTRLTAELARSAEQDVSRVIALYETWLAAGPPPIGTSMSRWWDQRLTELRDAINPGDDDSVDPTRATARWAYRLVNVLVDLDRCEHGRHEGDDCGSCGGRSHGNPNVGADRVIGYGRLGQPMFLPHRDRKHEPAAWRDPDQRPRRHPNTTAKDNT